MAQTSGFFNSRLDSQGNFDRVYLAEQFASYFSNFIGNGVFAHLLDKFVVTAGTGLSVNVGTGKAFCKGYWFESDANETLSIDLPDGLLNRKDNIVIRFDFENRTTGIYVVKGVAATTPSAPEVVRNSLVFELKIAEIFVGASISSISQSAITDTRSNNAVCGWVTGLVNQVNTSDLFLQYSQAYQEAIEQMQNDEQGMMSQMNTWFTNQRAAFDAWMSTLTEELNVDGYIKEEIHEFSGVGVVQDQHHNLDPNRLPDILEGYVNGLSVPVYLGDPEVIPSELLIGSYYLIIEETSWSSSILDIYYLKKENSTGPTYYINLDSNNAVTIKVGQWTPGVRS
jgi:hypothetical protein